MTASSFVRESSEKKRKGTIDENHKAKAERGRKGITSFNRKSLFSIYPPYEAMGWQFSTRLQQLARKRHY